MVIDLTAKSFVPGHGLYERVVSCLKERLDPVEMLAFWVQEGNTQDITFPDNIESKLFSPAATSEVWENIRTPIFEADTKIDDELLHELHNWAGALYNGVLSYLTERGTSFTTTFSPELPTKETAGISYTWKGMITPSYVEKQIEFLQDKVDSGEFPWALITVWGYEDTPVSWKECQRSFSVSGENDITMIILPGRYIMYLTVGPQDEFS